MASIAERVAVFNEEFTAAGEIYTEVRRAVASTGLVQSDANTNQFISFNAEHFNRQKVERATGRFITPIEEIADQALGKQDERLGCFDGWIAKQAIRLHQRDKVKADIPNRKRVLRESLEITDRIADNLDSLQATHAAIINRNNVSIYPLTGSQQLSFKELPAEGYENGDGGHTEVKPRREGIYLGLSNGLTGGAHRFESKVSFNAQENVSAQFPVFEQVVGGRSPGATFARIQGLRRYPQPSFDPASEQYRLPFIPLGSSEAPLSEKQMAEIFTEDMQRFNLRYASYLGGTAAWLTVSRPSDEVCNIVMQTIATDAVKLLQDGEAFDSVRKAIAASRRSNMRRSSLPPETKLIDRPLPHIRGILHGADVTVADVRDVVIEYIGKPQPPKTMREIVKTRPVDRKVDEFFDALQG